MDAFFAKLHIELVQRLESERKELHKLQKCRNELEAAFDKVTKEKNESELIYNYNILMFDRLAKSYEANNKEPDESYKQAEEYCIRYHSIYIFILTDYTDMERKFTEESTKYTKLIHEKKVSIRRLKATQQIMADVKHVWVI